MVGPSENSFGRPEAAQNTRTGERQGSPVLQHLLALGHLEDSFGVPHNAGERVEHGGAVREQLRAPGGCTKHMHW